jgi:hypothetical protein
MRLVSDLAEADPADRDDAECSNSVLSGLDQRPVAARADASCVRKALGGAVPERGEDPTGVVDALVAAAEPGLVASAGPRYFGFVTGGALPAALAADWLVSAWDQCAAFDSASSSRNSRALIALSSTTAGRYWNGIAGPRTYIPLRGIRRNRIWRVTSRTRDYCIGRSSSTSGEDALKRDDPVQHERGLTVLMRRTASGAPDHSRVHLRVCGTRVDFA